AMALVLRAARLDLDVLVAAEQARAGEGGADLDVARRVRVAVRGDGPGVAEDGRAGAHGLERCLGGGLHRLLNRLRTRGLLLVSALRQLERTRHEVVSLLVLVDEPRELLPQRLEFRRRRVERRTLFGRARPRLRH